MIFSGLQYCFLSWPGYSNVLHLYANVCICIVQEEKQLCPPRILSGVSCGVNVLRMGTVQRVTYLSHSKFRRKRVLREKKNNTYCIAQHCGCVLKMKSLLLV